MSKKQKRELKKIVISAVFFVGAFFVKKVSIFGISLLFFFSAATFLICGWESVVRAIKNLVRLNPLDEHLLMSVAAVGAFFIGEALEGAAVMLFYRIGELFQSVAVSKSRKSIAALADIAPEFACVFRDGKYVELDPSDVLVSDKLLIKPGERVPVDCKVISGSSDIDTKAVTGEGLPVAVAADSEIVSGSVNLSGVLYAEALSTYKNSTVAKILEICENVSSRKSKYESFIHRFAVVYTPFVVCSAFLLAVVPSLIFGTPSEWVRRALTFLVISCPCALVISVPLAFFAGLGRASSLGILIKGSNFLETLSMADTVVFDKTGTLTSGGFFVTDIIGENKEEILKLAASAEIYSNHPVSCAVKSAYSGELINLSDVKELAGFGVCAESDVGTILVGNRRLMEEYNITYKEADTPGTAVYIAKDTKFLGTIIVSDKVKKNAGAAIKILKKIGIKKTYILTGDKLSAAKAVQKEVGADELFSELLPQDKVAAMEKIMKESKAVIFAGDGINDAPVMAMADVSISMGQLGQDAAIEASDVVLTDDNLEKIPKAIAISKKTVSVASANIIFSIGVKLFVLLLGALGFANIWAAVFADVGVCVIAILNSVRLLNEKLIKF